MIEAKVGFVGDYIFCNQMDVWHHRESGSFAVGKMDEDHEDGGEIHELLPTLKHAIEYCLKHGS